MLQLALQYLQALAWQLSGALMECQLRDEAARTEVVTDGDEDCDEVVVRSRVSDGVGVREGLRA